MNADWPAANLAAQARCRRASPGGPAAMKSAATPRASLSKHAANYRASSSKNCFSSLISRMRFAKSRRALPRRDPNNDRRSAKSSIKRLAGSSRRRLRSLQIGG